MEYVQIDGVGVAVSRIVLGTDWFGARRAVHVAGRRVRLPLIDAARERRQFEILDAALSAGCTAFDTARAYDDSERSLGAWVRARGVRGRVAIISKGAHPGLQGPRVNPSAIAADLERSLRELRTEYIDVYLLHYDDPGVEVAPIIDLLNRFRLAGKIRAYGFSNWQRSRVIDAITYAARTGQTPPAASSLHYSLAVWQSAPWPGARSIAGDGAEDDREFYRGSRLWLLAYSSLAMGFFSTARLDSSGEYVPSTPPSLRDIVFASEPNFERLRRARQLAREIGASVGQVALAWVLQSDPKVLAVIGARQPPTVADAAVACDVRLSDAQRRWLETGAVPGPPSNRR